MPWGHLGAGDNLGSQGIPCGLGICGDSGVIWSSVFVIWGDLGVICGDSGDSGFLGGLPWGSFGLSPGGPSGRFFRDPFESSNPLSTLNPNLQLARLTTLSR